LDFTEEPYELTTSLAKHEPKSRMLGTCWRKVGEEMDTISGGSVARRSGPEPQETEQRSMRTVVSCASHCARSYNLISCCSSFRSVPSLFLSFLIAFYFRSSLSFCLFDHFPCIPSLQCSSDICSYVWAFFLPFMISSFVICL